MALVARGMARSRNQAAALIASGQVLVKGLESPKASSEVSQSTEISVSGDLYVARSAGKLAAALDAFEITVPQLCLDIGASTGGFTQVLLERGAAKVLAVDVGHNQLASELREDSRVVNLEGTNVRELDAAGLGFEPDQIRLTVADLSFISLTLVAEKFLELAPKAEVVALIKPQFELQRSRLNKAGVVAQAADRIEAVTKVVGAFDAIGYGLQHFAPSEVVGSHGNQEYLAHFFPGSASRISLDEIQDLI